jgi:hypothetical protein
MSLRLPRLTAQQMLRQVFATVLLGPSFFAVPALLAPVALYAQTAGEGAIQGTVTDNTGAVIPNAKVEVRSQSTGTVTTRTTTGDGLYTISPLIPGKYDVTVTADGFQKIAQQNIQVDALHTVGVNLALTVGGSDQTITVSAAPPALETTNATLGAVMENETYSNLPLQMSGQQRDPTAFATLVPGAQGGARSPIIAGTGNYLAEVYLDGLPVTTINQQGDNRPISNGLNVDAVDQFQVVTSTPAAEYQGAGLINFSMKSGGSKYHGSAAMYFRNTIFDTWSWASHIPGNRKPYENQNEIAATFGGKVPMTHDRLFFFVSYDRFHGRSGANPTPTTISTLLMRQGNFTELLPAGTNLTNVSQTGVTGQIFDPTSTTCVGSTCTRKPFQGLLNGVPTLNVIPANMISPIAKNMQQYLPQPTNSSRESNYVAGLPSGYDNYSLDARADYDLVPGKHRISYVLAMGTRTNAPYVNGGGTTNSLGLPYTWGDYAKIKPFITDIEHAWTINDHLQNQLKVGFTRFAQPITALTQNVHPYTATDLGITNLPAGQASSNFPGVTFASTTAFGTVQGQWTGAGASTATGNTVPNTYTLVDNLSMTKGRHNVTFGYSMQLLEDNVTAQATGSGVLVLPFNAYSTEQFSGTTLPTPNTQGYSYASFLLGAVGGSPSYAIQNVSETGGRYKAVSPYIQDDWKITQKLTINLGLRYDYFSPFHESKDRFSYLNPTAINAATGSAGALEFAGNVGTGISCNCRTPVNAYFKNVGPRVGVAYAVDEKTVFHAGFAVAYSRGGGVGGRLGAGTGTGGLGVTGTTATAPSEITSGASSGPSFYLNNSAVFQTLGLANTNFGGPSYVAPTFSGPTAASLTLNTGNYVNSAGNFVTAGAAPAYADPYLSGRAPQVEFYNLGGQRALTNDLTIALNYAGSQAHFINPSGVNGRGYWANSLDPKYLAGLGGVLASDGKTPILSAAATPANLALAQKAMPGIAAPYAGYTAAALKNSSATISQMLRAFPQYSSVSDIWGQNVGNVSYNSFQLSLSQREWRGLTYTLNYTYSKNIGDDGTFRSGFDLPSGAVSGGGQNWKQNRIDRSWSANSVPQNIAAYGVWKVPFGKGHMGNDSFLVRNFAGGWMMSGIFRYSSGAPLAITSTGCRSEVGTCMPDLNPNFSGTARLNGSYGRKNTASNATTQYLNSAAFQQPTNVGTAASPVYLVGTAPRTRALNLNSPGSYDLDMGVKRSFDLGSERFKFIFEANCLNVTNAHSIATNGINTAWTPGSTTFGRITGYTATSRDFQLAGHVNF